MFCSSLVTVMLQYMYTLFVPLLSFFLLFLILFVYFIFNILSLLFRFVLQILIPLLCHLIAFLSAIMNKDNLSVKGVATKYKNNLKLVHINARRGPMDLQPIDLQVAYKGLKCYVINKF